MAKFEQRNGVRVIAGGFGYDWSQNDSGDWVRNDHEGDSYYLEKRRKNGKDGTHDTGWYLYSKKPGSFFGDWAGKLLLGAVDAAELMIFQDEQGRKADAAEAKAAEQAQTPENTEPMPHLTRADAHGYPRTVWIDNVYADRHTDALLWADPADENKRDTPLARAGVLVVLNEARIRDLHAKLGKIIAEFDGREVV